MRMRIIGDAVVHHVVPIFFIAVALNYGWELAQAPRYVGMVDWESIIWHCFVASLGDGVLVCLMYAVGVILYRRAAWHITPPGHAIALMLTMGLIIGVTVEWIALNVLQRWAYLDTMPRLPGFNIGLLPVLQMLMLPPLILYLAGRWARRA